MTLEEKLRAYAAKGELVHLSLHSSGGRFHVTYAAASPAGGYASGDDVDPVEAIEKAFKASPVKSPRVSKPFSQKLAEESIALRKAEPFGLERSGLTTKDGSLSSEWTTP